METYKKPKLVDLHTSTLSIDDLQINKITEFSKYIFIECESKVLVLNNTRYQIFIFYNGNIEVPFRFRSETFISRHRSVIAYNAIVYVKEPVYYLCYNKTQFYFKNKTYMVGKIPVIYNINLPSYLHMP